ncbi:hypothetical protein LP418_03075 [Nocardioides sp. B-3]|nr:hypothetical protein [Nocardioides sp. B-3]UUZ60013.1 hypothetical protein LP418_03075 [Nocardioides sp. B-3]
MTQVDVPEVGEPPASPPRRPWGTIAGIVIPLALYVIVVLSGASLSSLGVASMREEPTAPLGTQWGEARDIRSDEYFTQSSQELAVPATGHSTHSLLARGPDITFRVSSGQLAESVLFTENNLLRLGPWLPDEQLFAAVRGFSLLLLALTLPPLLRRFGATTPTARLAVGLTIPAPVSLWWSLTPVRLISHASAGCLFLLLAHEQWVRAADRGRTALRRTGASALAAAGGIMLARFATNYVPWYITIGLPLVIATGLYLVREAPRRPAFIVLGAGAASGAAVLGATLWQNWSAIEATLNTLYPGQRRETGVMADAWAIFGTLGLYRLQGRRRAGDPEPAGDHVGVHALRNLGPVAPAPWSARRHATDARRRPGTGADHRFLGALVHGLVGFLRGQPARHQPRPPGPCGPVRRLRLRDAAGRRAGSCSQIRSRRRPRPGRTLRRDHDRRAAGPAGDPAGPVDDGGGRRLRDRGGAGVAPDREPSCAAGRSRLCGPRLSGRAHQPRALRPRRHARQQRRTARRRPRGRGPRPRRVHRRRLPGDLGAARGQRRPDAHRLADQRPQRGAVAQAGPDREVRGRLEPGRELPHHPLRAGAHARASRGRAVRRRDPVSVHPCELPESLKVGWIVTSTRHRGGCPDSEQEFRWSGRDQFLYSIRVGGDTADDADSREGQR